MAKEGGTMKRKYMIEFTQRLAQPSPAAFHSVASERDIEDAATPRPDKEYVDFNAVPVDQLEMHDRLENWARFCRGGDKQSGQAGTPMFNLYRSSDARRAYGAETSVPVRREDGAKLHGAIAALPDKPRKALQWCYLRPKAPALEAFRLGVTMPGLRDLIIEGRQLLIDGGV
jgi:hypothetical protein